MKQLLERMTSRPTSLVEENPIPLTEQQIRDLKVNQRVRLIMPDQELEAIISTEVTSYDPDRVIVTDTNGTKWHGYEGILYPPR